MLAKMVEKYYDESYDYNCAEAILYGANEMYELNLTPNSFKIMSAFGGGMAVEGTCGVISGALAVLGIMFVEERGHKSPIIKEVAKEYIDRFQKECSSANCTELKLKHRTDDKRCAYMVVKGGKILEEIIKEYNEKGREM